MNTKQFIGRFGLLILFFVFLYGIKRIHASITQVRTISFTCSAYASIACRQLLSRILTPEQVHQHNPHTLLTHIQQQLPSVEKIDIKRLRPEHAHIYVGFARPLARINTDLVLTQNKNFVSHTWYQEDLIQHLPELTIAASNPKAADVHTFFTKMPSAMAHAYNMRYNSKTEIILCDKQAPYLNLVAQANNNFDEHLLQNLAALKKIVTDRMKLKKYKYSMWKADVRFRDMIILSRM